MWLDARAGVAAASVITIAAVTCSVFLTAFMCFSSCDVDLGSVRTTGDPLPEHVELGELGGQEHRVKRRGFRDPLARLVMLALQIGDDGGVKEEPTVFGSGCECTRD